MPSPIGHALAGIAAGWIVAPPPRERRAMLGRAAGYGLVAASPDLDLLVGAHSGPTHGLGAALLAGATAWLFLRSARRSRAARVALAITAAYASHTLLDWLGTDTSPPIGIMALWPFSRAYFEYPWHVFMAISRRYWLREFWVYNLRALARELLILVPIVWTVTRYRRAGAIPNPRS
jgi:membrane-bound metal-dependent hydrolase YbcI (DUF457 family)